MEHNWIPVWVTVDLEGYRCSNCGNECLNPNEFEKQCKGDEAMVKIIEVKYKVGENGLGDYPEGMIVPAYLLDDDETLFETRFVYHPEELDRVSECIDVCKFDGEFWTPSDERYMNIDE